jgi:hypothetical protein
MTEQNKHTPEQNTTRDWYVETIDELTEESLENALNDIDQRGQTIKEVIPHQIKKAEEAGRQVAVDITSTLEHNNNFRRIWHVKRADGYGSYLEKVLQQAESEGWTIFSIIPHRIGKDNFPEVIMNRSYLDN